MLCSFFYLKAMTNILPIIIGTSGHVDHGKTSLIKVLTAVDTDTLPEEKRRGLTINPGFTFIKLSQGRKAGVIDVPGHEDFINNMISGASSIDILLLVTAADDGIMPQTLEHLRIASILRRIIVIGVITKIDLVDPAVADSVEEDLRKLLNENGFIQSSIIRFSAITGQGHDLIVKEIEKSVALVKKFSDERAFRMNAARVFTSKGRGSVITGIPVSGNVVPGDTLEILPGGEKCNVRTLQCYREEQSSSREGVCTALNLKNVPYTELFAGMTVAVPGCYMSTQSALGSLRNTDSKHVIPRISQCYFLSGTSKSTVSVRLLDREELLPGNRCFVRLIFEKDVVASAGDNFLIRLQNPNITLGGGELYSVSPPQKRKDITMQLLTQAENAMLQNDFLLCNLLCSDDYFAHAGIKDSARDLRNLIANFERLEKSGKLIRAGRNIWLIYDKLPLLAEKVKNHLSLYHKTNPDSFGISLKHLLRQIGGFDSVNIDAPLVCEALSSCISIGQKDGKIALSTHSALTKKEELFFDKLKAFLKNNGRDFIAAGTLFEKFNIPQGEMDDTLEKLEKNGFIKFCDNFVLPMENYMEIREKILKLFEIKKVILLEDIRTIISGGRHFLIALLESFDRDGLTERNAGGRIKKER